ncbi:MAG: Maf family protein [Ardenticatenales bacterium]
MPNPSPTTVGRPPPLRLLLASASPRRRALLASLDVPYAVASADVDETIAPDETPAGAAMRLALAKARVIAAAPASGDADDGTNGSDTGVTLVLGADTIVVACDGIDADDDSPARDIQQASAGTPHPSILGKPRDAVEAAAFLRRLRGRRHDVITGLAVVDAATGWATVAAETTAVWLRAFSDDEMAAYIATGDPLDKAGAYAIQHAGFHPVAALVGSESNVIGLPIGLVRRLVLGRGGLAGRGR